MGRTNPKHSYFVYGSQLKAVDRQLDLGITISNDLKWSTHINNIVKKCNTLIYLIQLCYKSRSPQLISKTYKTYIRPVLDYCAQIWSPYFLKDIELLEKVQRRVSKIPHTLKDMAYEERLNIMGLQSLQKRRERGDLIETFKLCSGYYKCAVLNMNFNQNFHLRGHNKKLNIEKSNRLPRKNFLVNRVVPNWNKLPSAVVNASSVDNFKNLLDKL